MKEVPICASEASEILRTLSEALPSCISGREAILRLRDDNSRHWKQMEWIGFWFEHFGRAALVSKLGGGYGPSYGKTEFDYKGNCVWDLKAHPVRKKDGKPASEIILNDEEAIRCVLEEYGMVGFIIAHGEAEFDQDGEFKSWHDQLKGKMSTYERERIKRSAPSRVRKRAFRIETLETIRLTSEALFRGLQDGWIGKFQEGMRNSNGRARRPKLTLRIDEVPVSVRTRVKLS